MNVVEWIFEPRHPCSRTHMYSRRGGGLWRKSSSSPHLSPLALLKRKRKQLRTPACPASLPGTETRAAKRVRPRAIISHQITVSGRGSGGRQGWSGAAGVAGRLPLRICSPSHPTSPKAGGGYHQADITQKCGRGVGLRGRAPWAGKEGEGEFHSPATAGKEGRAAALV